MSTQHLPLSKQADGAFDGGRIQENKPIGFPQDEGGMQPFSTLFYWAHAWSEPGGTIAEHPHRGFEIASFILSGKIEHYDNQARDWKELSEGDAQIIRSGNGISHAEKMGPGAALFQVWFDPQLERTLKQPASYTDYRAADFPRTSQNGMEQTTIVGPGSPFRMEAPAAVRRFRSDTGKLHIELDRDLTAAVYLLSGNGTVNGEQVGKDDFLVISDEALLVGDLQGPAEIFMIQVPARQPYPLYIDRYR